MLLVQACVMRLVLARTWIGRHFDEGDAPDERTVRDWVRRGEIPGREIGRRTYVDDEAFTQSTGNALADRIEAAAGIRC